MSVKRNEKRCKNGKFNSFWLDSYEIQEVVGPNTFYLSHLDGEKL
jgi:hypothetical protein